jgi:hypothetical protein
MVTEEKLDEISARLVHSPQISQLPCTGGWSFKFKDYPVSKE